MTQKSLDTTKRYNDNIEITNEETAVLTSTDVACLRTEWLRTILRFIYAKLLL